MKEKNKSLVTKIPLTLHYGSFEGGQGAEQRMSRIPWLDGAWKGVERHLPIYYLAKACA